MILEKHLTIKEARNEILKLQHELDLYLTKRNANFLRTQPGAVKPQEVIVDSSKVNYDVFLNYMIRDEEYDPKIYGLLASICAYQSYIAKEKERMSKYDEIGYIVHLREEEKLSWREIDKMLHRGDDYSRTKYKRYKKTGVKSN